MNVLSLFDGMACGRIALERAGFKIDNYFASEIDKYAIKVSKTNYPDIEHLGDVFWWRTWGLPNIDLLIGGSPCQGFSFAGRQLNFDDPRSALFFEFVRILEYYNPKYFLLENVKMKKKYQDVISSYMGVQPIEINSALVSAQNRKRLYWTNIPVAGLPEDKGILLKDILEDPRKIPVIKSYGKLIHKPDKSQCLDANYWKGADNHGQRTGCIQVGEASLNGHDCIKRIYSPDGKAPTLTAICGGNQEPKVAIGAALRGRKNQGDNDYTQKLELNGTEKANSLTTAQKDSLVSDGLFWRKLTPVECERLQTVPDNYTAVVSNSQRYKMLGNGWTIDVITYILQGMTI